MTKSKKKANILIVDDTLANLDLLRIILEKHGYRTRCAPNGKLALQSVAVDAPDLILLDVMMPKMDGYEVCRRLKVSKDTCDIPIIFLSAKDDTEAKVKCFETGGVDYILKPFEEIELLARMETHLTLHNVHLELERRVEKRTAELLVAKDKAEKASKLKSEFLARTNHELRTPLNAILGFSEIMTQKIFGDLGSVKYTEYAIDIHESASYLLELIEDIIDLSRIESHEHKLCKEYLETDKWISDCQPIINKLAQKKNIECIFDVPDSFHTVYADRRALKQILINIFSNGIKYTPDGGKVMLTLQSDEAWVVFKVSDTGTGISAAKIENITEPFIRAESDPHKAVEGTGLGLAVVKALVELHDGILLLESEMGVGTTITVQFPQQYND